MRQTSTAFSRDDASGLRAVLAERGYAAPQIELLTGLHALCVDELDRRLGEMLDELERQLFNQAEQARSNEIQRSLLETQRLIREKRDQFRPMFLSGLRQVLADPRDGGQDGEDEAGAGASLQFATLSLVDTGTMDETVILKEIATRNETRNSLALFLLGQRLGVVTRGPAFDAEHSPLGPRRLCRILRDAVGCFGLESEQRGLVYQQFDRSVLHQLTPFFEALNNFLIERGVLPHLTYVAPRSAKRPQRRREDAPGAADGTTAASPDAAAQDESGAVPLPNGAPDMGSIPSRGGGLFAAGPGAAAPAFAGRPHGGAPMPGLAAARPGGVGVFPPARGTVPQVPAPQSVAPMGSTTAGASVSHFGGVFPPAPARPSVWAPRAEPEGPGMVRGATDPGGQHALPWNLMGEYEAEAEGDDVQLFDTLRRLLAGRRGLLDRLKTGSGNAPVASPELVQRSLAAVQRSLNAAPVPDQSQAFADIKKQLLGQLRESAPDGVSPQLSVEQGDTVDLVGMLFEQIGQDVRPESTGGHLLARLQLPLLRVALRDQGFFTNRAHAARRLLEVVAETSAYWGNEDEIDRDLVEKMSVLVQRANEEIEENPELFDDLVENLTDHLNTQQRRAEIAERRHVEAARGREKLEIARLQAEEAIEGLISDKAVADFVQTLLEEAWIDVLALALLRGGVDTPAFRKHMALAERLVAAALLDAGRRPIQPAEADGIRTEIETALVQIGYAQRDTQDIVERLLAVEAAPAPVSLPGKASAGPEAVAGDTGQEAVRPEPATQASPAPAPVELTEKLRKRDRLGQDVRGQQARASRKAERAAPLTEAEKIWRERLRRLPYGTWFEFTINQQGDKARRRMSWFSNVTDHCMFVNLRGQRAGDYTLSWVARELARGNVSLVETRRGTIVDRAWKAIVSTLRSFSRGGDEDPAPTPA